LASIATWADTVKRVHFGPDVVVFDKDTQAFRRDLRNKNNRVWHFDDLPLDCPSYDACGDVYVPKPFVRCRGPWSSWLAAASISMSTGRSE